MEVGQFKELTEKLDVIKKLMVLNATSGLNKTQSVVKLKSVGLTNTVIAELLGTTRNSVDQMLHKSKKKRK